MGTGHLEPCYTASNPSIGESDDSLGHYSLPRCVTPIFVGGWVLSEAQKLSTTSPGERFLHFEGKNPPVLFTTILGEFPTTALVAVICPKDPITPTPPHLGLRKDIKASKFRFGGGTNAGWMATTPTEILLVAFLETCRVITRLFTSNKARPYCITSHGACWNI